jgi:hypothetical protein
VRAGGGWFWLDTLAPGTNMGLIGKYNTVGNQRAYLLTFSDAANVFQVYISSLGTAASTVGLSHTAILSASTWYHVVGRFIPNTELSIFVDGIEVFTAAGVPAAIFNSNTAFEIGSSDAGNNRLDGRACQCFLCSDYLDDIIIRSLFEQTRCNFGK